MDEHGIRGGGVETLHRTCTGKYMCFIMYEVYTVKCTKFHVQIVVLKEIPLFLEEGFKLHSNLKHGTLILVKSTHIKTSKKKLNSIPPQVSIDSDGKPKCRLGVGFLQVEKSYTDEVKDKS